MMLNQGQPAPLTQENLKKHQTETSRKQTPLKKFIARQTSLRSAGDGESVEWVCDEQFLKASESLEDQKSDEKQTSCEQTEKLPSDSTASVFSQDMNKQKAKDSTESTTKKNNRPSLTERHDRDKSENNENNKESSHEERFELDYDANSDNADGSEKENSDNDEDSEDESDSSSSLDSESDVLTKVSKSDQEDEDSNADSADSTRSSSALIEDDDEDDDDDDDDDDDSTEEEEEMEEDVKSDDELTHYSSSLNASVSSIPTLCDDRESPESSNSADESAEQNQDENVEDGQGNEVELPEQEQERKTEDGEEEDEEEAKMSEDAEGKQREEMPIDQENLSDHEDGSPPGSRQVSGRSATPLTVVMSEFDDVESTIFDRREQSPLCSSERDKLTPSEHSDCSEVSIKNWAGFGQSCVSSKADSAQRLCDKQVNHKENKRFKTRKERNVTKPSLIKKNVSKAKNSKEQPASKTISKKTDIKGKFIRQNSLSSDNSDTVNNQEKRITRPKKRLTKRVLFDNSKIENCTKRTTSDSAFFGSRTGSRDDEDQASPRPPESEHSSRASSRWSAVESEHGSSTGTRPVSTVQSPRSFFSSRQTTFVEKVTAANHVQVIRGKKAKLPSLKNRTPVRARGK